MRVEITTVRFKLKSSYVLHATAETQAATFRHLDHQFATRVIGADPARSVLLPRSGTSLEGLRYTHGGTRRTLQDFVANNRVGGLLVLKNGATVHEQCGLGNTETTRWSTQRDYGRRRGGAMERLARRR
jgi:hypothetical protein